MAAATSLNEGTFLIIRPARCCKLALQFIGSATSLSPCSAFENLNYTFACADRYKVWRLAAEKNSLLTARQDSSAFLPARSNQYFNWSVFQCAC